MPPGFSQREAISGVRVKLTSSEASVAATITMAKLRRNAPVMPVMKMIGPQTATSTRVIAMAAIPISRAAVDRRLLRLLAPLQVA